MRGYRNHAVVAALVFALGATVVTAQDTPEQNTQKKDTEEQSRGNSTPWYNPVKHNPLKLLKHYKSANDQLASNGQLEDKLSKQLRIQGILAEDKELQAVCSDFKDLPNCIAAQLHCCPSPERQRTCRIHLLEMERYRGEAE